MIVDGKKIAEDVYTALRTRIAGFSRVPKLSIITIAPNFETQKYLALKKKKASDIGIDTEVVELAVSCTTEEVIGAVQQVLPQCDGVVVQLPLPSHIDTTRVVRTIPPSHDVDALNIHTIKTLSPVVAACKEILSYHHISVEGKHVTILGSGKLVGIPAYQWFVTQGAHVSVVTKETADIPFYTKNADIIVCGAGVPKILMPDMIKEGVVILDAGTSEDGGMLVGDADPLCADKALLMTPVPGGIGPLTIAMLLKNVVDCASRTADMV